MADNNGIHNNSMEIQHFPLWDKLKGKRAPISFTIEITARCNMRCRHCYINLPAVDADAKNKELTVKEILNIGKQAVDMGAMWCLITGGEPLLRKDFAEIYMGLKKMGLLVSVFTNATLINNEHLELFRKYPPRDIETTVYGVTADTFETVTRVPGSFKKFKDNLDKLSESGLRIRLKSMVLKSNFHEHREIAEFCRSYTKDFYRFDPQIHLRFDGDPRRNDEIREERLTPEQIVALEEADEERIHAMRDNCDTFINEDFVHQEGDYLFNCGAGSGNFNVGYDGLFRLCTSLCAEGTTYDLRKGSLADAWHNFVPRVRDMRSQNKVFLDTCRKCSLVNLCLWCPAHAHLETGKLDGETPYFCEVAHKRAVSIKKDSK